MYNRRIALNGHTWMNMVRVLRLVTVLTGQDSGFMNTMGITRAAFQYLWQHFHPVYSKVSPRKPLLDSRGALGLFLHYLNSHCQQKTLCLIFGVTESTASKVLTRARKALLTVTEALPQCAIQWPNPVEMQAMTLLTVTRYPMLIGCFGVMDGTLMEIETPFKTKVEELFYSGKHLLLIYVLQGRKTMHCVNNIFVFMPNGCLCAASVNHHGE